MNDLKDWGWKLREATTKLKDNYDHIGRATGAPFLGLVYPPEAENAVLKEWRVLTSSLDDHFSLKTIDVLSLTMEVVEEIGVEAIVETIKDPMPGADPEKDLGSLWVERVTEQVLTPLEATHRRPVIILERTAALYPVSGPRAVMEALWSQYQSELPGPVVVLIPGTLVQPRVYSFLNRQEEFMYRGDIL